MSLAVPLVIFAIFTSRWVQRFILLTLRLILLSFGLQLLVVLLLAAIFRRRGRRRGVRRGCGVVASSPFSSDFCGAPSLETPCSWMRIPTHTVMDRTTNPNLTLSRFFFKPDVGGISSPTRLLLPSPL